MFKLLRYFSITSFVAFLLATVFVSLIYRQTALSDLVALGESKNVALTQAFANSLDSDLVTFLQSAEKLSDDQLRSSEEVARLRRAVLNQVKDLSVVKVKLFDGQGRTVFSTEPSEIGKITKSQGFFVARSGQVLTLHNHHNDFQAINRKITDRQLLSSYIPIEFENGSEQITGIFELYTDETPLVERIERTQRTIVLLATTIFSLLYGVVWLIVRQAHRILDNQYSQLAATQADLAQSHQELQQHVNQLHHQNRVLMELAKNKALHQGGLKEALQAITEATAQTLKIERVSVWLSDSEQTQIQCLDLFELSGKQHSEGIKLKATDYPSYFQALAADQLIAAENAHTDSRTCEFSSSYLKPLGIASMMDAPIRLSGQTVGVLCHEQVGQKRHWTSEEQNFARSCADLVSLVLEANQRQQAQEELRQSEVRERQKAQQLANTLSELKDAQAQLIQAAKMSALGQMVAGIGHEINNPVNFISGNLSYANDYFQDLMHLIEAYQHSYPEPTPEICQLSSEIELDFLVEDWQKLMHSMQVGADRLQQIVQSLRSFSRRHDDELKPADIHQGIDNSLLILQHRLQAEKNRPEIKLVKEYGQLPLVPCYSSLLNQVFVNLLANAIEALSEAATRTDNPLKEPQILIRTQILPAQPSSTTKKAIDCAVIEIVDNGPGISEEVVEQIFYPFFTTKPVGKGTGLGLSISYQIVVEKHGGKLRCVSTIGKGTSFIVEIPLQEKLSSLIELS
ncbi:MAG: ATP-binding protein [Coleofasciculaceae cyanobacterium]